MKKRISRFEKKYIKEVLNGEFRSSNSSVMVDRLEKAFSKRFGVNNSIAHNNGTATLHSILEAIGITVGDEVIVPPLTMASTAFAVLHANATPVFADVNPETFLITGKSIEHCITEKTRAVIAVSLYGLLPKMDEIIKVVKKYNLFLIEDNAQCFLGEYRGELAGKFGNAASYSFQSSKHITSGEGGMVTTDDRVLADKIRRISSLGYRGVNALNAKIKKIDIQDPAYIRHETLGWNYRMSELNAAVALGQLKNIDELIERRRASAGLFSDQVDNCSWLVPQKTTKEYKHSYWSWAVKLERDDVSWYEFRNKFMEFGGDGIYAAWQLTYLENAFRNRELLGREGFITSTRLNEYKRGICPNAENIQPRILAFKTNYWDIRDAEIQAEILRKTLKYFM